MIVVIEVCGEDWKYFSAEICASVVKGWYCEDRLSFTLIYENSSISVVIMVESLFKFGLG